MGDAVSPGVGRITEYQRIEKLGEGTYGVVYKAKVRRNGNIVALKRIRLDTEEDGVPATALREISILKELRHQNIVELLDVIMEEDRLYMVFEFCSEDLKHFIDGHRFSGINKVTIKTLSYQILLALSYCHSRRILHRDLKPQNILLDTESRPGLVVLKIADFGLARTHGVPLRVYTHEVVTLWYRAPEILLGAKQYWVGIDVWSIGCIISELFTCSPLFRGDSEIGQLFQIFQTLTTPTEVTWPGLSELPAYAPQFPSWTKDTLNEQTHNLIPEKALSLIRRCLVYNPESRISCFDALSHIFFDDLNKELFAAPD
ncbi:unnamed protein product [Cyprideis torosa]|uniref:cyclin-dependent kinase n=1 Tax=Cyprideis torosa TaxID=163714 RepID=A0A7R8ZT29_9CRUS|nr:unnamed protein product [Cyprideis torosa]CAG0897229.1 unnamed protein product [Cyprideis torosa]